MQNQFLAAIEQICEEKGISKKIVLDTIEAALVAAYKKDYGEKDQDVSIKFDPEASDIRVYVTKQVVKEVTNPHLEIALAEARSSKKTAKLGGKVKLEDSNKDFGRVAAQTAKQVIVQRIREAERDVIFNEFQSKVDTVINAVVQRIEGGNVFVDFGRAIGALYAVDQIPGEKYYIGQRLKVYVVRVEQSPRGPQIIVSRSQAAMLKRLFEMEVPEIAAGSVEIVNIAREAGARSKIAVKSNSEGVDAVGTFVGGRGTRVQAVMADLADEKIDVISYSDDPKSYITSALSPTKVINVILNDAEKQAKVKVPEDQLSLAIGKQGQNVRLAAKLTGWNIDIVSEDEAGVEAAAEAVEKPKKAKVNLEDSVIAAAENQAKTTKTAKSSKPKKTKKSAPATKPTTKVLKAETKP